MKLHKNLLVLAVFFSPLFLLAEGLVLGHLDQSQTAVLFSKDNRHFAISSDGGSKGTSQIVLDTGETIETKPLLDDWASGLSLFELKTAPKVNLPDFEDLFKDEELTKGPAEISGFTKTKNAFVSIKTEVLSVYGNRHTLPWASQTIEVKGIGTDYSLQGSALIREARFRGITSRQYLRLVPGSSTRVYEWSNQNLESLSIYYIVIQKSEMKRWVLSVLSGDKKDVAFSPKGKTSGDLEFSLLCPPEPEKPGSGPNPIGGPDGVGIGGEGSWVPPCEIELTKAQNLVSQWPFAHLEDWYKSVVEKSTTGKKSKLLFFVYREHKKQRLIRVPLYTLSEMAVLLRSKYRTPISIEVGAEASANPDLKALRETSRELLKVAEAVYVKYPDKAVSNFLRRLHLLGHVLNSQNWRMTTLADIDHVKDEKGEFFLAWHNLQFVFGSEKQKLTELLSKLFELRKKLS